MKHLRRFLMAALLLMVSSAWAYDFEVDGIRYDITNNNEPYEVRVTYKLIGPVTNSYSGDVIIPEYVSYEGITYSVTEIGQRAFQSCGELNSVVVPNSVRSIGALAFENSSNMVSITIGNSVNSISYRAFSGCGGLTSIVVEAENVTYDSRDNCNAVIETESNTIIKGCNTTIIPVSVTSIGENAFAGCAGLTSVDIPNAVTTISSYAFTGTGLASVTLASVREIGKGAFSHCSNLEMVELGNELTSLGGNGTNITDGVFSECINLISINIPYPVTCIEPYTFYECSNLTSVAIPNSVTSIGNHAFWGCTGLISINFPDSLISIGDYAFSGCSGLTSIILPDSLKSIGSDVFSYCTSLIDIKIPSSLTIIGRNPFSRCSELVSILVSSGNPKYDSRNNCNAIIETETNTLITGCKNTIIPNSVTSIGNEAFLGCSGLTSITIPNSVTSIGWLAFGSTGLTSVVIPNSVTAIGEYAFYYCSCLVEAIIGTKVNAIDHHAFSHCSKLGSVTIPNSVTTIGIEVFDCCTMLNDFVIPSSVREIGEGAFRDTRKYSDSNYWEDGLFYVDNCLLEASSGIESNCKIMEGTRLIANKTFYECSELISIDIPNTITNIGRISFGSCNNLTKVIVKSAIPPILGDNAFDGSEDVSLFVPCGHGEVYANTQGWSVFTNINDTDFPYAFEASSSDECIGSVLVTQQPDCENHVATVMAVPNEGCLFLNWTVNGLVVSTSNPYSFVVNEDIELVANFSGVGIEEDSAQLVTVSPNPAKDRIKVNCDDMRNISLFSSDGRKVRFINAIGANEMEIDISGLAKGLYMLRIETQNGKTINHKIIVQ